ncbi:alpha/beta hydrolase [Veronia pacifica]|uniref:Thioesterase n=1 Tax=Veronia pacifica TaxID=1080227 RepID=A0A1C3EMP9_9GAMM|nr:alpha/beta hydrolase [Veronia pacifica]ODA34495.1 thioesterase [Veronia pacifica]
MYSEEQVWRELQQYLPSDNQLTDELMPREKFFGLSNYNIHLDEYIPTDETDVCIIVFHGVGGNGRLLSFMAIPLFKQGYEVICPDLPGYGFSEFEKYPTYNDWIDIGCEIAKSKIAENKKVILLGLSAGGMLAYNVACKVGKVNGLIITNILDNRITTVREHSARYKFMGTYGLSLLKKVPSVIKKIKVPISLCTNMKGLVNDKRVLNVLLKDKRGAGNNVELGFLLSMMNSVPVKEPEEFTDIPVLLCHPGDDKWTPTSISELFFDRIKASKYKVILENCGHFPIEQPGKEKMEDKILNFIRSTTS